MTTRHDEFGGTPSRRKVASAWLMWTQVDLRHPAPEIERRVEQAVTPAVGVLAGPAMSVVTASAFGRLAAAARGLVLVGEDHPPGKAIFRHAVVSSSVHSA